MSPSCGRNRFNAWYPATLPAALRVLRPPLLSFRIRLCAIPSSRAPVAHSAGGRRLPPHHPPPPHPPPCPSPPPPTLGCPAIASTVTSASQMRLFPRFPPLLRPLSLVWHRPPTSPANRPAARSATSAATRPPTPLPSSAANPKFRSSHRPRFRVRSHRRSPTLRYPAEATPSTVSHPPTSPPSPPSSLSALPTP